MYLYESDEYSYSCQDGGTQRLITSLDLDELKERLKKYILERISVDHCGTEDFFIHVAEQGEGVYIYSPGPGDSVGGCPGLQILQFSLGAEDVLTFEEFQRKREEWQTHLRNLEQSRKRSFEQQQYQQYLTLKKQFEGETE